MKYEVTYYYHTNATVTVEAETEKEAIEKGYNLIENDDLIGGLQEDDSPDAVCVELEEERSTIKRILMETLALTYINHRELEELVDAILDDVIIDIYESADPENWNNDDVIMALSRVLRNNAGLSV